MNFQLQTGTKDCFPTCFGNAMFHFGVAMTPALQKRLALFKDGTESCTIYAPQERLENYERSIHKFAAEWHWALGHTNDTGRYQPQQWATDLIKAGIEIEARNGPVEQQKLIIDSLKNGTIAICEIWIPSDEIPDSESKHFVLIIKLAGGKLFMHDPLPGDRSVLFDSDNVAYAENECGSNLRIDSNYFFSNEIAYMKPKPNPFQQDYGYKFLLISKK